MNNDKIVAFYEEALKYAKKTTKVNQIKRKLEFHRWISEFTEITG
jgi:hypothetical protein